MSAVHAAATDVVLGRQGLRAASSEPSTLPPGLSRQEMVDTLMARLTSFDLLPHPLMGRHRMLAFDQSLLSELLT